MTALTITIDRTSLSLSPLVLSGNDDSNDLGVVNYTRPAEQSRLGQMPDAPDIHGTEYNSWSLQQALLNFDYVTDKATDEADVQAFRREVSAAVQQFAFLITTQEGNADPEVWSANAGSVGPVSRQYTDLANHNPVFPVQVPVYPIPGA